MVLLECQNIIKKFKNKQIKCKYERERIFKKYKIDIRKINKRIIRG